MTTTTLRPNGSAISGVFDQAGTFNPSGTILADDSDGTYVRRADSNAVNVFANSDPGSACEFNAFSLPGGNVVKSVVGRSRLVDTGGSQQYRIRLQQLISGSYTTQVDTGFFGQNGAITTYSTGAYTANVDPNTFGVITSLNGSWDSSASFRNRVYETYLDVVHVPPPSASVTGPSGVIGTRSPTISWLFTQGSDGTGLQTFYQVKIFSAAQYSAGGFDPNTFASTYDQGVINSGSTSHTVVVPLPNTATYKAYVLVWQTTNGVNQGSSYAIGPAFSMDIIVSATASATWALTATATTAVEVLAVAAGAWGGMAGAVTATPKAPVMATAAAAWGGMAGAAVVTPGTLPSTKHWSDVYVEFLVKVADPPPSIPTQILIEPFDNFTAAPWTASFFNIVAGRTGNGAQSSGTSSCSYNIPSGQQSDVLTLGFAVKVSTLASQRPLVYLRSSGGVNIQNCVTFETNGSITVRRGNAAGIILGQTAAGLVVANTFYYVELQIKLHNTLGTVILNLDGIERLNLTGLDTNVNSDVLYDQIYLTGVSGGSHTYDDLYLRNDTTFVGDPITIISVPSSLTPFVLERLLVERNHLGGYFDGSTVTGGFLSGTPSISDYRWEGAANASRSLYSNEYERTNGIVDALLFDAFPITEAAKYTILSYNGVHGITDAAATRWGRSKWDQGTWS